MTAAVDSVQPNLAAIEAKLSPTALKKAKANAQDFEAVFLNSMFQHMFTNADGEGPMGNSGGVGPWRSFLTDEYAKSFAKSGGIGLAKHVYASLIAHQAAAQHG
jgi:Rod binding domain-containing protein